MPPRTLVVVALVVHLFACRAQPIGSAPAPSPAPSARPSAALRFDSDHLSYSPLPGWTDARAEEAKGFVDPEAQRKWQQPARGEIFHLSAPLGSGFIVAELSSLDVPVDTDPIFLLQSVSESMRDHFAKGGFSYELIIQPRRIQIRGITGAEIYVRWEIDGRWQREAERVFIRDGHAYLLSCSWKDALGDDPPDARRALDGLQFDP